MIPGATERCMLLLLVCLHILLPSWICILLPPFFLPLYSVVIICKFCCSCIGSVYYIVMLQGYSILIIVIIVTVTIYQKLLMKCHIVIYISVILTIIRLSPLALINGHRGHIWLLKIFCQKIFENKGNIWIWIWISCN